MKRLETVYTRDVIADWNLSQSGEERVDLDHRDIKGIAAIIISRDGKILLVEETQEKPVLDKKIGDWGIPMETKMVTESGKVEEDEETLRRLIEEETGLDGQGLEIGGHHNWQGDYMIGVDRPVWGRTYVVRCNADSTELKKVTDAFVAKKEEVSRLEWVDPKRFACLPRRRGVWEMVQDFNSNNSQGGDGGKFIRGECSPGSRL